MLDERLGTLLARSGYSGAQLRANERVWTPSGDVHPQVVGFAHMSGPFDTSTATLIGGFSDVERHRDLKQMLDAAAQLATPLVLAGDGRGVTVHSVGADGSSVYAQDFDWLDTSLVTGLSPRALLQAKLGQRQSALFPIDANLLVRSRRNTEEALGPRVANLLTYASEVLGRRPGIDSTAEMHAQAARLVIGALTAVVLRDKENLSKDLPGAALLDTVLQRHPAQFQWALQLALWDHNILEWCIDHLNDVDFAFAEPALLSEIYESRLVDDAARRSLGAHYTPPTLAEKMLRHLPVEELEPNHRMVLDPTCGSGTLLLAAHDRLRNLQPADWTQATSHAQLVAQLHGTDIDPVAVEIANLSLLLHALPAGNGWDVRPANALRPHTPGAYDIVVANPPWHWTNQGSHEDIAHDFLRRMIRRLRPGGLLGVVLPVAWLTRNTSRTSRAEVRRDCETFEVWRLPAGTFSDAGSGATVVLARRAIRRRRNAQPIIESVVSHSRELPAFYAGNLPREPQLLDSFSDEALASGPVLRMLARQTDKWSRLEAFADVVSGPQPASQDELIRRGAQDGRLSRNAYFLAMPGKIPRFGLVTEAHVKAIAFPGEMQNESRRGEAGLGRPKILVPAAMAPSNPWRLRPAIDFLGVLPRNSVSMVIPKREHLSTLGMQEDEFLYAMSAYLGSGLASTIIFESIQTRKIGAPQLKALPVPDRSLLKELASIGEQLSAAAMAGTADQVAGLRESLDAILWEWSDLPSDVVSLARSRLGAASEAGRAGVGVSGRQVWSRPGRVLGIDVTRREPLWLDISGTAAKAGWIQVPPRFPGALLHPNATFVAHMTERSNLSDADYTFDPVKYLSDEDVIADLMEN